jgi:hypothetical protein
MSIIKINDMCVVGSNLLIDSESYLDELFDASTLEITGGASPVVTIASTAIGALFVASLAFSYNVGRNYTR